MEIASWFGYAAVALWKSKEDFLWIRKMLGCKGGRRRRAGSDLFVLDWEK